MCEHSPAISRPATRRAPLIMLQRQQRAFVRSSSFCRSHFPIVRRAAHRREGVRISGSITRMCVPISTNDDSHSDNVSGPSFRKTIRTIKCVRAHVADERSALIVPHWEHIEYNIYDIVYECVREHIRGTSVCRSDGMKIPHLSVCATWFTYKYHFGFRMRIPAYFTYIPNIFTEHTTSYAHRCIRFVCVKHAHNHVLCSCMFRSG